MAMKVTYMITPKLNFYLSADLKFNELKAGVEETLFVDYKLPKCETRMYWIDYANDEIGIFSQKDLDIWYSHHGLLQGLHLFVKPTKPGSLNEELIGGAATESNEAANVVHTLVECDGCQAAPIIGFRYKCIQCPNFDLCESCESQHKHAHHMMVRMPTKSCPQVVQSWISEAGAIGLGRHGKGRRSARIRCPFVPAAGPAGVFSPNTENANDKTAGASGIQDVGRDSKSHSHGRHGHKHHRRQERHGFLSNLYDMMTDLAEGGPVVEPYEANAEAAAAAASEVAAASVAVSTKAAEAAAVAASTIAAELAAAVQNVGAVAEQHAATFNASNKAPPLTTEPKVEPDQSQQANTTVTQISPSGINAEQQANTSAKATTASEGAANCNAGANTNTTTPVLDINNLMQFIDPQYMKTGIQILNNFSDMFAKMLDPIDGAASLHNSPNSSPANKSNNSTRKSSLASNTSSSAPSTPNSINNTTNASSACANDTTLASNMSSAASSTPNSTKITANDATGSSLNDTSAYSAVNSTAETTATTTAHSTGVELTNNMTQQTTTDLSAVGSMAEASSMDQSRERSNSEDNDWQMIDKQTIGVNESFDNVSATSSSSNGSLYSIAAAGANAIDISAQKTEINYEKLSKDLKAHIEQEIQTPPKKSQSPSASKNLIDLNAVTISDLPNDNTDNITTFSANTAAGANISAPKNGNAGAAAAENLINSERRAIPVYHHEPRINSSVLAMMTMGFSNEGGKLTQLLESVDGNISQALDLMSIVQRGGQ